MYALLAVFPIILALLLMVSFNVKSGLSLLIAWIVGCGIAFGVWRMDLPYIIGFSVSGFIRAADVILIIFGAVFLLNTLSREGIIDSIGRGFSRISQDRRIQILIIGWMFGAFIEGAAGFGTPAALAAPLLVGIGIPPFAAALACLIANSTPVCFGVIGVPSMTGFATILPAVEQLADVDPAAYAAQLYGMVGLINMLTGTFIPFVIIMMMIVFFFGKTRSFKDGLAVFPLCLYAGASFTVPYYLLAAFVGPELPTLLGSIIGFVLLIGGVKAGLFVPKTVWRFPGDAPIVENDNQKEDISIVKAWAPYAIIATFLILTRAPWLPFKDIVRNTFISFTNIMGIQGVNYNWAIFNNPGIFPFIIITVLLLFFYGLSANDSKQIIAKTLKQITNAAVALSGGVALVQIMTNTHFNTSGMENMTTVVAKTLAEVFGGMYPMVAPLVGAFGAFVAGSNTVSNVMFARLQFDTALMVNLPTILICAQQFVGGAVGSMICVNSVVAVAATTGAHGKEGQLIMAGMVPCALYIFAVSAVAFILLAMNYNFIG